jgi:cytochrome c551/c552
MKLIKSLILRNIKRSILSFSLSILAVGFVSAQDGKKLFETNCSACHHPTKNGTGPALKGVKAKWEAEATETDIYVWVQNWENAVASGDAYAASVAASRADKMSKFGFLSNEDIDAIFDYVENGGGETETGGGSMADCYVDLEKQKLEEEANSSVDWVWYVLAIFFIVVIVAVGGLRRQLVNANRVKEGAEVLPEQSRGEVLRGWAWRNRKIVSVLGVVTFLTILVFVVNGLNTIGVYPNYKPEQPIKMFSHKLHAGCDEIACQYCHNTVEKSRTAGIPTVNVCMNCHKSIDGHTEDGQKDVLKIREHAGWDGDQFAYVNEGTPIVWNKVHVLPDHVYFSHQQHVKVGGIDCKQCHGDMTKETIARIVPVEELNKIEGNIQLTRPTLTMGWCLECHRESGVNLDKSGYYKEIKKRLTTNKKLYKRFLEDKDHKVTVEELGGWECAKCHY